MEFSVKEATDLIKNILPKEARELKVFDIYNDIENEKKSFAFRIIFQSDEKTLSDEFANGEMEKIYEILKKNNFEIR
jgi:phenylalanyl-tRNA synthetase beta subunit